MARRKAAEWFALVARWKRSGKTAEEFGAAEGVRGACRWSMSCTGGSRISTNSVNPLAYLTDVIGKLQSGWPKNRLDELLPNVWKPGGSPRDG
ncbi:transposase domain-containing protein [Polyangium jinanense]|uniref:transposase domain-containing protein n=1 Tax=Polyangium jinanense TaxID=2829994 RepID=UPI0035598BB2